MLGDKRSDERTITLQQHLNTNSNTWDFKGSRGRGGLGGSMPADLRGRSRARRSQRALAHTKRSQLSCWGGLDYREVVNVHKYLPSVLEHNLKESWKGENNLICSASGDLPPSFHFHFIFLPTSGFLLYCPCPFTTPTTNFLAPFFRDIPRLVQILIVLVLRAMLCWLPGTKWKPSGEGLGSAHLNFTWNTACTDRLSTDSSLGLSGQELTAGCCRTEHLTTVPDII